MDAQCVEKKDSYIEKETFLNELKVKLEALNKSLSECKAQNRNVLERFRGSNPESESEEGPTPSSGREKILFLIQGVQSLADECLEQSNEFNTIL